MTRGSSGRDPSSGRPSLDGGTEAGGRPAALPPGPEAHLPGGTTREGAEGAGSEQGPGADDRPEVSIVIVVYKTPEFLRRCLDSLEAAELSFRWEAIVIDNAPGSGECGAVCHGRGQVHYVPNERNVGFGRACNQGMRLARGRHYFMLNPDVEVRPGSIEALLDLLEREKDVGMAAPRLHYGDGTLQESCRTFYTLPIFLLRRTFLGKLFPNSRLIREHLMLDWDHEETRDVDWCLGAGLLARGEAVADVGLMDERFFMYFEDVDWCYRMHQRGWRVVYHPRSRMIHHYQRASRGWRPSRGLWIHLGSTLRYYEKWSFLLYWLKLRSRSLRTAALFASDLVMILGAFLLAYTARSLAGGVLTKPLFGLGSYARFIAFTVVVSMGSFIVSGLYRQRMSPSWAENGLPVARAVAWTSILMMAATFLFSVRTFSRVIVLLFFPIAVLLVTAGRVLLLRAVDSVRRRDLNLHRLGILGPAAAVDELLARFDRHGRFGMEPVPLDRESDAAATPEQLLFRIRSERVQEVVLFEDWPGPVRPLLAALRERAVPVRVLPALRDDLPVGTRLGDFMGWPALALAEAGPAARTPGRRFLDALAVLVFGILWLPVFLAVAAARRIGGRPVVERARLRGRGGRKIALRRLAGARDGRGFWRAILDWYPALPALARGDVSLVGVYPFDEAGWEALSPAYRRRPPAAAPGLLGPWTVSSLSFDDLTRWNRAYARVWSTAEEFRIFWRVVFAVGRSNGG